MKLSDNDAAGILKDLLICEGWIRRSYGSGDLVVFAEEQRVDSAQLDIFIRPNIACQEELVVRENVGVVGVRKTCRIQRHQVALAGLQLSSAESSQGSGARGVRTIDDRAIEIGGNLVRMLAGIRRANFKGELVRSGNQRHGQVEAAFLIKRDLFAIERKGNQRGCVNIRRHFSTQDNIRSIHRAVACRLDIRHSIHCRGPWCGSARTQARAGNLPLRISNLALRNPAIRAGVEIHLPPPRVSGAHGTCREGARRLGWLVADDFTSGGEIVPNG